MSLLPYRALWRLRAVRHLLLVGAVARIPVAAAGIVLVLHVQGTLGRSWLEAGLVGAATTAGAAVGSPWRGRLIDRFGLRRTLAPSIVVEAVVWGTVPWLAYEPLLVAAAVAGVMGLPIFTVVRQSLSVLVPDVQRRTAYAVDSIMVELSFMSGPALGVLVATQVSTRAAVLGVGVTMVAAGVVLFWFNPPTRSEQLAGRRIGADVDVAEVVSQHAPVAAAGAQRAALEEQTDDVTVPPVAVDARDRQRIASPAMLGVLAAAAGATVVLHGTDIGVVAVLRDSGQVHLSAVVFAAWGLGSIAGGLLHGAARRTVHPLWLLLALALLTAPIGISSSAWTLALAIVPAGMLCAPVISSTAEAVARLAPERRRGEAMGWHGSAMTVGGAVGGPAAGLAVDVVGPWGGFALVGAAGAALAVSALALQQVRRRTGRLS